MRFASFAVALGILLSGLALRPAFAATATASFGVSATVQSACQASTPATAFGSYVTPERSNVSVSCTILTPYNVSSSAEVTTGSISEIASSSKTLLHYTLLPGSSHLVNRGQAVNTGTLASSGKGPAQAHAIFGQTAQAWHVSSGAFADAITVTVTY